MRELMSTRLKFIVYFVITWAYAYADLFTGQIGYVIRIPPLMPVQPLVDGKPSGPIELWKRKEACACQHLTTCEVLLDDKYNTSDHYHNPVTHLHLQCNPWPMTYSMMGVFIMNWLGQIVFNGLGDVIGRKIIVVVGLATGVTVYILICFPYNFTLFVIYSLVLGFGLAYFI